MEETGEACLLYDVELLDLGKGGEGDPSKIRRVVRLDAFVW